jgi:sugar (pentulose or hexulose) kinase
VLKKRWIKVSIIETKQAISENKTALGIELGSTRIKAVLTGADYEPIASGSHDWENRLEDGVWTYHLEDVWGNTGLFFQVEP